jgi:hypothetical protein
MQAIAHNALTEFEESIDSQQVLCARLAKLADELCAARGEPAKLSWADCFRPGHDEQIRAADRTLEHPESTLRSILLQHSSRSVRSDASLFSSFKDKFRRLLAPG